MNSKTIQKSRLRFFAERLVFSAILFASFALLVRLSWYPGAHFYIDGAARRLLILASVILVLGPALSTLLYRPGKSKLLVDMGILLALEVAAIGIAAKEDPAELSELVTSVVLEGAADIDRRPDLWHPYSSGHDEVLDKGCETAGHHRYLPVAGVEL